MRRLIDFYEVKPAKLRDVVQFLAAEFDPDIVLQVAITVLSLAAIAMISTTGTWHRWGFVVGLISQPFWILATWRARQWGMFGLSVIYVFVWIFGIGARFV